MNTPSQISNYITDFLNSNKNKDEVISFSTDDLQKIVSYMDKLQQIENVLEPLKTTNTHNDYLELLKKISSEKEIPSIVEPDRKNVLINNLLSEICNKTDIPKDQYIPWLKEEVGFTEKELNDLKDNGLLPEPEEPMELDV